MEVPEIFRKIQCEIVVVIDIVMCLSVCVSLFVYPAAKEPILSDY